MEWLRISTSTELVRVKTDDIVFVKAYGNYSEILLYNGKKHTMTFQLHFFDESFKRLKDNFFVRVGRSLIVNLHYILVVNLTDQTIKLSGGKLTNVYELQASREALKELKNQLENEALPAWMKGGES